MLLRHVLALIAIPPLWAAGPCLTADLGERASAARNSGEYRVAANIYRELSERCPGMLEFRMNAGLMLHLAGDYEAALPEFRQAAKANNKLFAANLFAGVDPLKLRKYSDATSYLLIAYSLNKTDLTVNIALGQAYADVGEYAKANEAYQRATAIDARNADAWYGLAVTYLAVQRQAIEAITEFPDATKHLDRIAHIDFDKIPGERKDFDNILRAADAADSDVESLCNLAIVAGTLARGAITRVITLDPSSARVHVLLGNAHSELHDVAKAKEEFDEALRIQPESFPAHLALATMYAREGEHDQALGELRRVLKARPQDPEAGYLQARMLMNDQSMKRLYLFLSMPSRALRRISHTFMLCAEKPMPPLGRRMRRSLSTNKPLRLTEKVCITTSCIEYTCVPVTARERKRC